MKILVTGMVQEKGLKELYKHFEVTYDHGNPFTRQQILEQLGDYDGVLLMGERADKEFIDAGKKLKIISVNGVGFDNVDCEYARSLGIAVTNTPVAVMEPTAEMTMALMLSLTRRILEYDGNIRQGVWLNVSDEKNMGFCLNNTILGVFGMGRIGKSVAKKAQAFGMKVIYNDHFRLPSEQEQDMNVEYASFEELLTKSDVITLHAPYNQQTHHRFGKEQFDQMKSTAFLVNAARGGLVDEQALVNALKDGQIAGAALDVFNNEPYPNKELFMLQNVVMTPHAGTGCIASRTELSAEASENIISLLCNGIEKNVVNQR